MVAAATSAATEVAAQAWRIVEVDVGYAIVKEAVYSAEDVVWADVSAKGDALAVGAESKDVAPATV